MTPGAEGIPDTLFHTDQNGKKCVLFSTFRHEMSIFLKAKKKINLNTIKLFDRNEIHCLQQPFDISESHGYTSAFAYVICVNR